MALSTSFLERKGSESARLDAQLLTAHVLGIRRLDLYLAPDRPLSATERDTLRELVVRRGRSEPVAYLIGHREFFGLEFKVTPAVLIPRPETESIVDAALTFLDGREWTQGHPAVVDVGTGSGAIACTIAHRVPAARVWATDISAPALEVAAHNAADLGVADRIAFVHSDILGSVTTPDRFDLIVSNPPYIAETEVDMVDTAAREFEPRNALFSGADGTTCTFALIGQAADRLAPDGALMIEVGTPAQTALVAARLGKSFQNVGEIRDPGGNIRGLRATGVIGRDAHGPEEN